MKKEEKSIIYLFSLTTNFKPNSLVNFNNVNIFSNKFKKNKNKIMCRNFFLFLILLKYNKRNSFKKSSFFIKPLKKNLQTILRAPYRHKLTRHQITLLRYNVIFKLVLNPKKSINVKKFKDINIIFKSLSKYNNWVDSNIISNYKIRFCFDFSYINNFIIINYTKNKNN